MANLLNPYIAGAPVVESSMFFGRQDVFNWIERSLAGKYVDHTLIIHGQRRVGKTSVLKQIPNHLSNRYIHVYLDIQGRTQTTLDRFLWWMAREIVRTLRSEWGRIISVPEQGAFSQDSEFFHTQFLPALRPHLLDQVLLLTLDEFDILGQSETMESLDKSLTDYFSRLFEIENLNFIFSIGSSGKKLENMQAAYTEFFKAALYKKISFLEKDECCQLITCPVAGVLAYDPDAVERIYQITSGHPYYTQLICYELFSTCQKEDKHSILRADVEAILPAVVERGTVNLKFVWDEVSELEKWALACLAQMEEGADFAALAAELRDQLVRFSEPDLNSALLHLQEKDVLSADLRFIVSLMRLWLHINRPIERVRQELVEINPIANRFIEIGDEYKERSSDHDAIRSYQQALAADPGNLKAQVSIAEVYLAQKDYAQAAQTYERALGIDPEGIMARSGFCQAHLELGEDALARGDVTIAIDHLRRVVDVNPDHSEVRQRLADILCRQAEELFARGEATGALKAFHAATHYTPEDEKLLERYNQVCSQVKGRVLAELLEQASAEWKRQNWSQAISCLEDYLQFEPDSEEVRSRIKDLRHQQRLSQLTEFKAQAQAMEKSERWDEAIHAWQEYQVLGPEDPSEPEKAIQKAQLFGGLAESYEQAQAALQVREYSRAIQLLQGVITQEPSYKDAARLLSGAIVVERKHRPAWLNPWAVAAFLFIAATIIALVSWKDLRILLTKLTFRSPIASTTQPVEGGILNPDRTQLATSPTAPVKTAISSFTPTSPPTMTSIPSWVADFADPVLKSVAGMQPVFQDDFSYDTQWMDLYGNLEEKKGTTFNGVYRLTSSIGKTIQRLPCQVREYVLEFDLQPQEFSGEEATFGVVLRGDASGKHYLFEVDPGNHVYRFKRMFFGDYTAEVIAEGVLPELNPYSPTNIKVLDSGDQLAFLWNDDPLSSFTNLSFEGMGVGLSLSAGTGTAVVEIDNLKLWDLYPIDIPSWVDELALPALNYIRSHPPDFSDEFSKPGVIWDVRSYNENKITGYYNFSDFIQNGTLRFDVGQNINYKFFRKFTDTLYWAFQFDILPGISEGRVGINFRGNQLVFIDLHPGMCMWENGIDEISDIKRGEFPSTGGKPLRILMIVQGDHSIFYLNEKFLTHYQGLPPDNIVAPEKFQFRIHTDLNTMHAVALDNFKYWALEAP